MAAAARGLECNTKVAVGTALVSVIGTVNIISCSKAKINDSHVFYFPVKLERGHDVVAFNRPKQKR